jgi:NTP pyrophosphatase (non-canonical NTP hydrolase)
MMELFDEYQELANTTRSEQRGDMELAVLTLGLSGETGEFVERVKKKLGHGHPLPATLVMDELGDILWYVTVLASYYDLSLSGIADNNIKKLAHRYPDGFVEGGGIR